MFCSFKYNLEYTIKYKERCRSMKRLKIDSCVVLYTFSEAELFNERSSLDSLLCLLAYSSSYRKKLFNYL